MAAGQLQAVIQFVRRLVQAGATDAVTDRHLLHRFAAAQDQAAFAELVARHGPMVLNVCRRVLGDAHAAEDAFQAVFLVLARKAAAVRWRESVSSWLYEVACRTAMKARTNAARRRAHERRANDMNQPDLSTDLAWCELRGVLDQELSQLPEKYRAPLVLCYLEGKTNEEAAQLLGWTKGTVSGRLARARDLLRDRLTRRGLALSAGTLGLALTQNTSEAALAPALAETVVRAAAVFAAGTPAPGTIAAPVAALTEGVLQAMFVTKLKIALTFVLLLAVVGTGMGLLAYALVGQQAAAVPIGEAKPQEPAGGKEVNGLKLTLSADKTETVLKADGSNAEPVKLKLTFTNVSAKPIKLDAYDIFGYHAKLEITGPDAQNVHVDYPKFDRKVRPATEADFPTVQAGQKFVLPEQPAFPGSLAVSLGEVAYYHLRKPGEYRVRITYEKPEKDARQNLPWAAGTWTGRLTSNELTLKVKPAPDAGKEVNGLKLTLSADKTETVMKADGSNAEPVKLKLTFTNVSDKPIKLDTHVSSWRHLKATVAAPDDKSLRLQTALGRVSKPPVPVATEFPSLEPGKSWLITADWTFPGSLPIQDLGGTSYTVLKPGEFRIKFDYENSKELNHPLAKGSWTGTLASNDLVLTVKPAAR